MKNKNKMIKSTHIITKNLLNELNSVILDLLNNNGNGKDLKKNILKIFEKNILELENFNGKKYNLKYF
jgi:hypothetical protein